jgi:Fur family transcriptional regulator, ferric uptake regulator
MNKAGMLQYNEKIIITRLKENGMPVTKNRRAVLKVLQQQKTPVSVAIITKSSNLNRVSVYRTLQLFLAKELVHLIPSRGHPRYILADNSETSNHKGNNFSSCFVCTKCNYTEFIPQPAFKISAIHCEHEVHTYNLVIEGICNACKKIEHPFARSL